MSPCIILFPINHRKTHTNTHYAERSRIFNQLYPGVLLIIASLVFIQEIRSMACGEKLVCEYKSRISLINNHSSIADGTDRIIVGKMAG